MSLSLSEVEHIAALARLNLTAEEKEKFRLQLSAILDYAASLQEVNTDDIPPTSSVLNAQDTLREDVPASSLNTNELLEEAPETKNNQFKVPPVME